MNDEGLKLENAAPSPDPVVVRLQAEVERLNGDYAKLYGVVREYIACEKHPQMRGEAYRDLRGTYDVLTGADADQGWPACYQRIQKQLDEAREETSRLRCELNGVAALATKVTQNSPTGLFDCIERVREVCDDNTRLRGLLREACELRQRLGCQWQDTLTGEDWTKRVTAALEARP